MKERIPSEHPPASLEQAVLLQLEDISKDYLSGGFGGIAVQKTTALRGIGLQLLQGEILSVLGESGSGKSTLARCMVGQIAPSKGNILLRNLLSEDENGILEWGSGGAGAGLRRHINRIIQLVPQATQNSLNPHRRVGSILKSLVGRAEPDLHDPWRRVGELMELTGLHSDYLDRFPARLSGGQRQRLLIARALAMKPRIIVFDEPVSSLDVSIQARLLNTLKELKEALDLTFVFITHDLDIAEYISDRMAIIHQGRLVELGPVQQVVNNPRHEYTRGLLAAGLQKQQWLQVHGYS